MGAIRGKLRYSSLSSLIELKLAAGRLRDEADVLELARENRDQIDNIRRHLGAANSQYLDQFDELRMEIKEDPNS